MNQTSILSKKLTSWARVRGYESVLGNIGILEQIRKEWENLLGSGDLDPVFYDWQLNYFKYPLELEFSNPKSIILMAVPRRSHVLTFLTDGDDLNVVIPPTYVDYRVLREKIRDDLDENIFRGTANVANLVAPLKAAAARLGLVKYGRNNIAYHPEMGSYFQLVGLVTDAEFPEAHGGNEHSLMCDECENCSLCMNACPTGAVSSDRFLLRAERCFTLFTEYADPWPAWMTESQHRRCRNVPSIIGCMTCQVVCPMNRGRFNLEESGVIFTVNETRAILREQSDDTSPEMKSVRAKLEEIDMVDSMDVIGRNLKGLMKYSIEKLTCLAC